MVCFFLGQQRGFTKYPCHLCMWDSRDREKHWNTGPRRNALSVKLWKQACQTMCTTHSKPRKDNFSPLHIKLDLMKQFVKALDSDGECFQHIFSAFSKLSFDKTKAGVFDGAQICTLVRDEEFVNKINEKEKAAWL